MKKNFHLALFGASVCVVFLMTTCKNFSDLSVPNKVSIKTGAQISLSAGKKYFEVGDFFKNDIKNMLEDIGSENQIYDYQPAGGDNSVMTYMLHRNVQNIEFDIAKDLNFDITGNDDDNANMEFERKIKIDKVDFKENIEQDLSSFTNDIKNTMKSGNGETLSLTLPGGTGGNIENLSNATGGNGAKIETTFSYASQIQFTENSTFKITVAPPNESDNLSSVKLKAEIPAQANFSGSESAEVEVKDGGTITLPLSDNNGGRLSSPFEIQFSGSYSGGTSGTQYKYTIRLSNNAEIACLYNVKTSDNRSTLQLPEIEIDQSFTLTKPELVNSVIIGKNSEIRINVENPASWTGVRLEWDNNNPFSMSGAITKDNLTAEDVNPSNALLNQTYNLEGSNIDFKNPPPTAIFKGKLKIQLDDSNTIYLTKNDGSSVEKISGTVECSIKKIGTAYADLSNIAKIEKNDDLPDGVKYVKKVYFTTDENHQNHKNDRNEVWQKSEGLGIKCNVTNTLPVENDIGISLNSSLFKLNVKGKIPANSNNKSVLWSGYPETIELDPNSKMDLKVSLASPNDDDVQISNFPLTNLEIEKEYEFAVQDVEFVFDWEKADVEIPTDEKSKKAGTIELQDISMKKIFGDRLEKEIYNEIQFQKIPLYFYIQKPSGDVGDALNDMQFSVSAKLTYTNKDNEKIVDSIMEKSDPVKLVTKSIDFHDPKKEFIFSTELNENNASRHVGLEKTLNDQPENLIIDYDAELSGISGEGKTIQIYNYGITKIKEEEGVTKIAIDIALVFPLQIKTEATLDINFLKLLDLENKDDLLFRDNEDEYNEFAKYADFVKSMKIYFNIENQIIDNLNAKFSVFDAENTGIVWKDIPIFAGGALDISGSNAEYILKHNFKPKITLTVPKGQIRVLRSGVENNKSVGFCPVVSLKLNGEKTFDF